MGRRSRGHPCRRRGARKTSVRVRTRYLVPRQAFPDQVIERLKPKQAVALTRQPVDPEKPGLGQHYCIVCDRYFVSEAALRQHVRTKRHRALLRNALTVPTYTGPPTQVTANAPKATTLPSFDALPLGSVASDPHLITPGSPLIVTTLDVSRAEEPRPDPRGR